VGAMRLNQDAIGHSEDVENSKNDVVDDDSTRDTELINQIIEFGYLPDGSPIMEVEQKKKSMVII